MRICARTNTRAYTHVRALVARPAPARVRDRTPLTLAFFPSSVPALTAARSMSPVARWHRQCSSLMAGDCEPLPQPGGPARSGATGRGRCARAIRRQRSPRERRYTHTCAHARPIGRVQTRRPAHAREHARPYTHAHTARVHAPPSPAHPIHIWARATSAHSVGRGARARARGRARAPAPTRMTRFSGLSAHSTRRRSSAMSSSVGMSAMLPIAPPPSRCSCCCARARACEGGGGMGGLGSTASRARCGGNGCDAHRCRYRTALILAIITVFQCRVILYPIHETHFDGYFRCVCGGGDVWVSSCANFAMRSLSASRLERSKGPGLTCVPAC